MTTKLLSLLAITTLLLAFTNCTQSQTTNEDASSTDEPVAPAEDPAEVVAHFYHEYDANPDFEKVLTNPVLHPDYVKFLKSAKNDDYDIIVNAQDCICCNGDGDTGQCKTETLENTGATAKVKLFNGFGDHHANVLLVNVNGKWLIKKVDFLME